METLLIKHLQRLTCVTTRAANNSRVQAKAEQSVLLLHHTPFVGGLVSPANSLGPAHVVSIIIIIVKARLNSSLGHMWPPGTCLICQPLGNTVRHLFHHPGLTPPKTHKPDLLSETLNKLSSKRKERKANNFQIKCKLSYSPSCRI